MSIRDDIEKKYKQSLIEKNTNLTNTLRSIKSAIKYKDLAARGLGSKDEIKDQEILGLLQNLIKQRKDSIESFQVASRDDLIVKEQLEIDLISQFLPKQLSELDTVNIIETIIKDQNFSSLKDMGTLMNILKTNHAGSVNMSIAGKISKLLLGN